MHGDFSLDPRRHGTHVSRVLYQMGRVQLDSDANEQTEATLHFLRALGADVIGVHAGLGDSFKILPGPAGSKPAEFVIRWGHYWIDGIPCVNLPPGVAWWQLVLEPEKYGEGLPVVKHADSYWQDKFASDKDLLYLAVWERHISAAEDDRIREVALNGPDTTSRAVIVWQIRSIPFELVDAIAKKLKDVAPFDANYLALKILLRGRGRMRAKARENEKTDPCVISPEARYRGEANQLYRVEIHDQEDGQAKKATFKWSSDNASIVYPIKDIAKKTIYLESLGRDERTAIMKNDWVEVVDDEIALRRIANPLLQVVKIDRQRRTIELNDEPRAEAGRDPKKHPILRRWADKPRTFDEAPSDDLKSDWEELSDGIEVQFSRLAQPDQAPPWRTGDYWLIPARAATGNIIWPGGDDSPEALAPHGIDEHYAPLATAGTAGRAGAAFADLRFTFDPIRKKAT